jgi:hypothetical protein
MLMLVSDREIVVRKVIGATGFEPATPCAQDTFSAFSCDFLHFPIWP